MPQTIDNMSVTWTNSLTTYTGIKLNAAGSSDANSAAASLLMDLQVGGASQLKVSKGGVVTSSAVSASATGPAITFGSAANTGIGSKSSTGAQLTTWIDGTLRSQWAGNVMRLRDDQQIGWASGDPSGTSQDTIIRRRGVANLAIGTLDAAAPVAQTLSVQSVVAGTSNTAGANLTITGSQGTGTGAGGSIVFQVAPAGSSGTAQNALVDGLTINSNRSITIGTAVTIGGNSAVSSTFSSNSFAFLGNGTGFQAYNGAYIGFSSTGTATGTADVLLYRDTSNTLALRNGANAQSFNIYKTYTSDTNYERVTYGYSATSGGYGISAEKGSSGGGNNDIYINTQNRLFLDVSQNRAWVISSTRTLYPANTQSTTMTDNFLNIPGASGAPTGTPAVTTGFPIYYDSSAHKIYVYAGGTWRSTAALT